MGLALQERVSNSVNKINAIVAQERLVPINP